MKQLITGAAMLLLLAACSMEETERLRGTVTNVVDGDTIDVQLQDGEEERVRLLLIDTPETKHPRLGVQPFGPEASAFTDDMLLNEEVELELDVSERDRYGRVLAYVWQGDKLFNERLLEEGLARVAIYPPDTRYVDEFETLQDEAQQAGIGIWSIENYVTDKGFDGVVEEDEPEAEAPDGCDIKGNINSRGDRIYHENGTRYYDQTIPEAWFCTVEEAEAAGFRAPR